MKTSSSRVSEKEESVVSDTCSPGCSSGWHSARPREPSRPSFPSFLWRHTCTPDQKALSSAEPLSALTFSAFHSLIDPLHLPNDRQSLVTLGTPLRSFVVGNIGRFVVRPLGSSISRSRSSRLRHGATGMGRRSVGRLLPERGRGRGSATGGIPASGAKCRRGRRRGRSAAADLGQHGHQLLPERGDGAVSAVPAVGGRLRLRLGAGRARPRAISRPQPGRQRLPEKVRQRGSPLRRDGAEAEISGEGD